ncbi:MAG TPA: RidA family protein [Symbiobacteriaceae bacterium]|nr:RidA family protein [Symbiobacteriaceae bacterium]
MTKECFYPWPPGPEDTPIADAVALGNLVFTAGQLGQDYETGAVPGDMGSQTWLALDNLSTALRAAGSEVGKILKVTIYVTDISRIDEMNQVYRQYFSFAANPPARTTVEVKGLAVPGLMIEVEAIGYR